jgi:hypothetical protein
LASLDTQERELDERILVAAGRRRIEAVGLLLFPPDERDAS